MTSNPRTPHTITIKITPDGKVIGEVTGVKGAQCSPLSAWLDELGVVEVDEHTDDYRKSPGQSVTLKTGN